MSRTPGRGLGWFVAINVNLDTRPSSFTDQRKGAYGVPTAWLRESPSLSGRQRIALCVAADEGLRTARRPRRAQGLGDRADAPAGHRNKQRRAVERLIGDCDGIGEPGERI